MQISDSDQYSLPTKLTTDGKPRKVGIEIEFAGLNLEEAVSIVTSTIGGVPGDKTAAEQKVDVEALGEFGVEVDWNFLKRLSENEDIPEGLTQALSDSATAVVPVEIVCPPVEPQQLQELEELVRELRKAGAKGTEESLFYAFGLHINVELPDCDAVTLDRYLKAYVLLQDWLLAKNATDVSRRITPYIDLYPEEYLLRVLKRKQPGISEIIDDYLEYNATRNRALDMLPLLSHIDEDRVKDKIDDERIKPRPTFHYRQPDCRIDDPDWSLAQPWGVWLTVERLADDSKLLDKLVKSALEEKSGQPQLLQDTWIKEVDQWLHA